jgi:uncharacterized membrane protein SirB2
MKILYFIMIPLFSLIIYKRVNYIIVDIKKENRSKLKADLFFFAIILIVMFFIIYLATV